MIFESLRNNYTQVYFIKSTIINTLANTNKNLSEVLYQSKPQIFASDDFIFHNG